MKICGLDLLTILRIFKRNQNKNFQFLLTNFSLISCLNSLISLAFEVYETFASLKIILDMFAVLKRENRLTLEEYAKVEAFFAS